MKSALTEIFYGKWVPPKVSSRPVINEEMLTERVRKEHKEFGKRATKRAIERANANAERIRVHVMANPGCTAKEIGEALGLTKSPVYNHLTRFKNEKKVVVGRKKVGTYTIVSYKWVTGE